jgi:hypothetical protein
MRGRAWRPLWAALGVAAVLIALAAAPAAAAVPAHGRAWELVTATDPQGTQLILTRAWRADGEAVVIGTIGPMPGAVSGELLSHSIATRTASGWRSVPVTAAYTTPEARFFGTAAMAVSTDLSNWVWGSVNPLLPGGPENPLLGIYRRDAAGGLALVDDIGAESTFTTPTSASDNLAHVGFDLREALVPADSGRIAGSAAYEVAGNELRLAGVGENGEPLSACGSRLGNNEFDRAARRSTISRDGSRVFFTSPDPNTGACAEPPAVYLREDGTHTLAISASQCTRPDCNAPAPVSFAGASADGASAYLITTQQLTDDDVDATADLYRYDRADGSLTRVSAGPPGSAANVIPPIRAADHGERVYFRATGSLVPGQSSEGTGNLYFRDGDGPLRYLANISGQSLESAAISADGSAFLFEAQVPPLPGDTDTLTDVFHYDAPSSTLRRASSGSAGRGNGPFTATIPFVEEILPTQSPSPLSADGRRAFFVSAEALLPEDADEALDVYEWAVGGGLGLVTPAAKGEPVLYKGASADGSSIFFETREGLLDEDQDGGESDLYAARLGGGFPAPPETPECAGASCQGGLPARLAVAPPDTLARTREGRRPRRSRGFGLRLSAASRERLITTGRGVAIVHAPAAGRISLAAFAAVGGGAPVASAEAVAWRPGRVAVPFQLGAAARDHLARHHSLRLRLVVRHSRVAKAREAVVELREPR